MNKYTSLKNILLIPGFFLLTGCGSNYSEKMSLDSTPNLNLEMTTAFFFDESPKIAEDAKQLLVNYEKVEKISTVSSSNTLKLTDDLSLLPESIEKTKLIELAQKAEKAYASAYSQWDEVVLPEKIKQEQDKIDAIQAKVKESKEYVAKYNSEIEPLQQKVKDSELQVDELAKKLDEIQQKATSNFNDKIISKRLPYRKVNELFSSSFNIYTGISSSKCDSKNGLTYGFRSYIAVMEGGKCNKFTILPNAKLVEKVGTDDIKASLIEYSKIYSDYATNNDALNQAKKGLRNQQIIASNIYPDVNKELRIINEAKVKIKLSESVIASLKSKAGHPGYEYLSGITDLNQFKVEYKKMIDNFTIMSLMVKDFDKKHLVGSTKFDGNNLLAKTLENSGKLVVLKTTNLTNKVVKNYFQVEEQKFKVCNIFYIDLNNEKLKLNDADVFNVEEKSSIHEKQTLKASFFDKASKENREVLVNLMAIQGLVAGQKKI